MSIAKFTANTDPNCPIPNRAIVPSKSFFESILHTINISGSDNKVTVHEYTVIIIPACASVMWKLAAISLKSPIGINSEVLNINAESVIPRSGSHSLNVIFLFIMLSLSFLFYVKLLKSE